MLKTAWVTSDILSFICFVACSRHWLTYCATVMFATDPGSLLIPSLGASGAISGVLGGYIVLYPHRRVTAIVFRFLTDVPAYVAIGIWFAFQLISGLGMFGGGSQQGGVAYAAHVGGFIAGLALIKVFTIGREARQHTAQPELLTRLLSGKIKHVDD